MLAFGFCLMLPGPAAAQGRTITANVVILDHVLVFNRLGAQNVNGMIYALKRDVVDAAGVALTEPTARAIPGQVRLRDDKRPRPLVLRVNVGDTLVVNFTNLLTPAANPFPPLPDEANPCEGCPPDNPLLALNDQVAGRYAGFHAQGMQLVGDIGSDASFVGKNPNSLAVSSGGTAVYQFLAQHEGTFLVTSYGATFGGEGTGGNVGIGAFAVVTVEPPGARYYRSQVTEEELRLARTGTTAEGHPVLPFGQAGKGYEARYPQLEPWIREGKDGMPILNMLDGSEIVHSDINAIIAGGNADGSFPPSTYPLESLGQRNPTVPNRLEPFREFTVVFHDEQAAANAFPAWFAPNQPIGHTTHGVRDSFMINYGSGGIGSEIIANRLGVGPMWDCLDCAYEEFFLTSFAVGDPAMLVDVPANTGLEACGPDLNPASCDAVGPKATRAFYPDDPANVHHSYIGDFTKYRNLHAGPKEQHIFHLHNHQWLFNANDDNSNYLDAQGVGPGSGYTYEINNGGSGNRNKTAGDAIFHCHFYPHFAQGMWELWRIHDTMEVGTQLQVSGGANGFHVTPFGLKDGTPAVVDASTQARARALPDGEILAGTPIPAVVPLPGKPMPPMPGRVTVVTKDTNVDGVPEASVADVDRTDLYPDGHPLAGQLKNPGFPFWIAGVDCGGPEGLRDPTRCRDGIVGQRPTTPPMDMMTVEDATALASSGNPLFSHPGFINAAGGFDGGLPRHALEGFRAAENGLGTGRGDSSVVEQHQTRLDFRKVVHKAKPVYFPEEGTDLEQAAMAYHGQTRHDTYRPDGSRALDGAGFRTNGAPPVPGAPYQEPCVDDKGKLFTAGATGEFFGAASGAFFPFSNPQFNAERPRVYKAANIQIDAVFNKVGYHFPQQRIISLWEDVGALRNNQKPPEPFVLRMNTFDCTQYYHSNLVPNEYQLDDFQVRTPTDIIGQHIHLPKWDLTTADGAANGWNYEDGTLSPGSVIERIEAINAFNADPTKRKVATLPKPDGSDGGLTELAAAPHPRFGELGGRVTIQRWFSDPVVNTELEDRGLGIIFTHDHYGPSTHQQVGLYGTVLTEPARSVWKHNETGALLASGRSDGGPTSWQAIIEPAAAGGPGLPASADSFREFYFEFGDFQHAYEKGAPGILSVANPDPGSFRKAINPSFRQQAGLPDIVRFPPSCPGGVPRPCPEAISADDVGMLVVNYRNEPVGQRVFDPARLGPDGKPGTQASGLAGDLSFALQTRTDRKIAALNTALGSTPYPALTRDQRPGDPFTPKMRAYSGDLVKIKIQSGATEHEHSATVHGMKWLQGGSGHGSAPNSGWRNAQTDGISEQFTLSSPVNADMNQLFPTADYAYSMDASQDGWWSGVWGVLRDYKLPRTDLKELSSNNVRFLQFIENRNEFKYGVCPANAPERSYDISAVLANQVLPRPAGVTIPANGGRDSDGDGTGDNEGGPLNPNGGTLIYNPRDTVAQFQGPLHDPTAMLYLKTDDLTAAPVTAADATACAAGGVRNPNCPVKIKGGVPLEPLTLRAAAGDCIRVTLRNRLPSVAPDLGGYNTLLAMVTRDRNGPQGVTSFNNNLIRPSSHVGLHPQLVEYDVTMADGTNVGINNPLLGTQLAAPTGIALNRIRQYTWYAGHLEKVRTGPLTARLKATPVEFGAASLMPADKIKQGQKGLVGALIIEPKGSTWTEDANKRSAATVKSGLKTFRDFAVIFQKGLNLRYKDGTAVENIAAEGGTIPEDSVDAGQKAINYATEPVWYRFGLPPNAPFGNAPGGLGGVGNAHELYSNILAGGQDPATPVFTVAAGQAFRMRLLEPTGVGRGTTFNLHGHIWQRDPYLAGTVPSQTIGKNPHGFYLGHQENVNPGAHYDVVLDSAGGARKVVGDYLFRDHASFGNTDGLWGIVRVQ
jgi:hypothetical protein